MNTPKKRRKTKTRREKEKERAREKRTKFCWFACISYPRMPNMERKMYCAFCVHQSCDMIVLAAYVWGWVSVALFTPPPFHSFYSPLCISLFFSVSLLQRPHTNWCFVFFSLILLYSILHLRVFSDTAFNNIISIQRERVENKNERQKRNRTHVWRNSSSVNMLYELVALPQNMSRQ